MFIRGRTWPALSGAVADKDSQARDGVTLVHLETRVLSRLLASRVLIYGGRGGPHWGLERKGGIGKEGGWGGGWGRGLAEGDMRRNAEKKMEIKRK